MASPQLDNGYIKIATEIYEALCKIRINGEARQVLDFIIRKTYGYHKKQDKISLSQFTLGTGLKKTHIIRGLNKLKQMKLIIQIDNDDINIYRFNKDFDDWKPLPKKVTLPKKVMTVTQKGNASLPKKVHTIDKPTKDNITKGVCDLEKLNITTGDKYKPDNISPLDVKNNKRKLARALGEKRANKWSDFIFGSGWDFLRAYRAFIKQDYVGNVILDEVAKNMAKFYEAGETRETIQNMILTFAESEKRERVGMSPTTVFSTDTYNKWKSGELKPKGKKSKWP